MLNNNNNPNNRQRQRPAGAAAGLQNVFNRGGGAAGTGVSPRVVVIPFHHSKIFPFQESFQIHFKHGNKPTKNSYSISIMNIHSMRGLGIVQLDESSWAKNVRSGWKLVRPNKFAATRAWTMVNPNRPGRFLKFSKNLPKKFQSSISPQLRVPEEGTIARLKGLILGFHFGQVSPCRRAPLPSEF